MENDRGPATSIRNLVRWTITPPQSYAVYLIGLFLVAGMSFYAGTLKPKHSVGLAPPAVSVPRD
ncbi:hypothetical protein [Bradyrhizobium sp. McL0615]|jgi:hypothetical protein|uniref:hypothetical protein n=1 Tax=Bradyrhizobium sp. McL0615 TaxID=3415673 RepID=UPI003CE790D4